MLYPISLGYLITSNATLYDITDIQFRNAILTYLFYKIIKTTFYKLLIVYNLTTYRLNHIDMKSFYRIS